MIVYNLSAAFWQGQPAGYSTAIIYSSRSRAIVPETDPEFTAWLASTGNRTGLPWPLDEAGAPTIAALDAVLAAAGAPLTGLATASFATLAAAVIDAVTATCADVVAQILPDAVHQSAYQLVAAMCGPSATPPTIDPIKTDFDGLAAAYALTPQQLATMVVAIAAAAIQLRSIQQAAQTAATAATTTAQLAAAVASFEESLGALITTLNAALVAPITAPSAITIAGVNA